MAPQAFWKYRVLAFFSRFAMAPAETVTPQQARQALKKTVTGPAFLVGRKPPLALVADELIAGIAVRRYRPLNAGPGTVVFFHGGGWMLGDVPSYDVMAATLAQESGCEVVSVEYRLAPEHPYPAGLNDCLAVARALLAQGPVAVAGDSAGGNLAAVVANTLPVAAQFLMYPVTDLVAETPSHAHYATGHILTREAIRYFRAQYVPDPAQRGAPEASPLRHPDLRHSPPALITVAQCDVLRDEGLAYAERLKAAGVEVCCVEVPGALHGYASLLGLSEARATLRQGGRWLAQALARFPSVSSSIKESE